jgi:integrase
MSFLIIYFGVCEGSFLAAKSLSFDEWYKVYSQISGKREHLLFHILYATGCSEKDLLMLKISDVTTSSITFSKRTCDISEALSQEIKLFIQNRSTNEFLFTSRQSSALSPKRLQQLITSASATYGIKLTPQDIRYTHIFHALLKNVPLVSIARKTGLGYQRLAQIVEQLEPQIQSVRYEL